MTDNRAEWPQNRIPGYKRTLFTFSVLHTGWECDEEGWVVELGDGSRVIVETSHNSPYIAKPESVLERIAEYEEVIATTRKALAMIETTPVSPS